MRLPYFHPTSVRYLNKSDGNDLPYTTNNLPVCKPYLLLHPIRQLQLLSFSVCHVKRNGCGQKYRLVSRKISLIWHTISEPGIYVRHRKLPIHPNLYFPLGRSVIV